MEQFDGKNTRTVVDFTEIPLSGPIYDGLDAKLTLEVRDFGEPERTLVIRTVVDGKPITTLVRWDAFTDALDTMRANMMTENWDDSLAQLIGGS